MTNQDTIASVSTAPISGWEESFAKIDISDFLVNIVYDKGKFTREECDRMDLKIRMVEELAQRLSYNMSKGTKKYRTDEWSDEQWAAFEEDERFDQINYYLLRRAAQESEDKTNPTAAELIEIARKNGFIIKGDQLIQVDH